MLLSLALRCLRCLRCRAGSRSLLGGRVELARERSTMGRPLHLISIVVLVHVRRYLLFPCRVVVLLLVFSSVVNRLGVRPGFRQRSFSSSVFHIRFVLGSSGVALASWCLSCVLPCVFLRFSGGGGTAGDLNAVTFLFGS